jgi:hypothetical protein
MNLAQKCCNCLRNTYGTMPLSVSIPTVTCCKCICDNRHPEADGIKVAIHLFTTHSFSPGSIQAASSASPGNKWNTILICDVTLIPVLSSTFVVHNITYTYKSEIKYDSHETDDR